MIVHTLNSRYEIDPENMRFRRVWGKHDPTHNFEEDGMWHDGTSTIPEVGTRLTFLWSDGVKMTQTSPVLGVDQ